MKKETQLNDTQKIDRILDTINGSFVTNAYNGTAGRQATADNAPELVSWLIEKYARYLSMLNIIKELAKPLSGLSDIDHDVVEIVRDALYKEKGWNTDSLEEVIDDWAFYLDAGDFVRADDWERAKKDLIARITKLTGGVE